MYDVIIIGSGIVGLVNALLLAQHTSLRLAILDAKVPLKTWSPHSYDSRVYALSPATQRVFMELGVWQKIVDQRASSFTHMSVWDSEGGGALHFDHRHFNVPALGYIVEENLLREILVEKLKVYPHLQFLCPLNLKAIQEHQEYIELHCEASPYAAGEGVKGNASVLLSAQEGSVIIRTQLLIGADGAESRVREQAKFPLGVHDYQQNALIAQVETELPHQSRARQCFLSGNAYPPGPLAFLPLKEAHLSSIVWSTLPEQAAALLQMEEPVFRKTLGEAFAFRLGKIIAVSQRASFPLYGRHVAHYVKERIALIGDAAHTLHPLAGQGLNLGIADAVCLAQVVIAAVRKGRDFFSKASLRPYERARQGNNRLMLSSVGVLKRVFTSDLNIAQNLRSGCLNITNRLRFLKSFFAHYAMGYADLNARENNKGNGEQLPL